MHIEGVLEYYLTLKRTPQMVVPVFMVFGAYKIPLSAIALFLIQLSKLKPPRGRFFK